jgi:hypothetical protein
LASSAASARSRSASGGKKRRRNGTPIDAQASNSVWLTTWNETGAWCASVSDESATSARS